MRIESLRRFSLAQLPTPIEATRSLRLDLQRRDLAPVEREDELEALPRRIAGAGGAVAYARTDVRPREELTSLVKTGV
jgi:hypothetical protein